MAIETFNLTVDFGTWQGRAAKLCARIGLGRLTSFFIEMLVDRMMREQGLAK